MIKPVEGALLAALLLLAGCASNPAPQTDALSPETASPTPAVSAAPASVPAESPVAEASAPDPLSDTTVIPGDRVGPITRNTSRQELAELFGESNLTDKDIDVGEGETDPATVVDLGAERSLTVIWSDSDRTKLVGVQDLGSAWKTPEGIGVGTSLAELQEKLGEFQLYGFDWDYGGTVELKDSQLAKYDGSLILRVQPEEGASDNAPDDYQAVVGDRLFSSTDPHFQNLGIKVDEMIVSLVPNN